MDFFDWFLLAMGACGIFSGCRTIKNKSASSDVGEHEGGGAVALGYFWLALGVACIATVVFDIRPVKSILVFFFQNHT